MVVLITITQGSGCQRSQTAATAAKTSSVASQQVAKTELQQSKAGAKEPGTKKVNPQSIRLKTVEIKSTVQLLSVDQVRNQLTLTEDQKKKLAEIDQKRADMNKKLSEAGEGMLRKQLTAKLVALRRESSKQLAEILNQSQQDQLARIAIQINGARSVADPFIGARLGITEKQETELTKIRSKTNNVINKLTNDVRKGDASLKDAQPKAEQLRAEADREMLEILTAEQNAEFASLKGNAAKITFKQLKAPTNPSKQISSDNQN